MILTLHPLFISTKHGAPQWHTTLKWRRINVDATWSRRIDVGTTSFWCCVPAGTQGIYCISIQIYYNVQKITRVWKGDFGAHAKSKDSDQTCAFRPFDAYQYDIRYRMKCSARKRLLCNLRATQAQICLRIRAGWSEPSLSAYRINGYYNTCRRTANAYSRLHGCACWSGPSLFAYDLFSKFRITWFFK